MGSIWLAWDQTLNAEVAIKLLNAEYAGSKELIARFHREALSTAAVRSAHVVQVLDWGVENDCPYIAMERLSGESLEERLRRVGKLTPGETERILWQTARALGIAHERGIVHRDVKPGNIFLVREGDDQICKLLDFGIAHQTDDGHALDAWKTKTGAILGTPCYMSPEQVEGRQVDHLTDIWSFGIIACECMTGKPPFRYDSLPMLFHAICMMPMPVPSRIAPVPRGFDAWFARTTARDKSLRFRSIREAARQRQNGGRGPGEFTPHQLRADALRGGTTAQSHVGALEPEPGPDAAPAREAVTRGGGRSGQRARLIRPAVLLSTAPFALAAALLVDREPTPTRDNDPVPESTRLDDYVAPRVATQWSQIQHTMSVQDAGAAPLVGTSISIGARPSGAPPARRAIGAPSRRQSTSASAAPTAPATLSVTAAPSSAPRVDNVAGI